MGFCSQNTYHVILQNLSRRPFLNHILAIKHSFIPSSKHQRKRINAHIKKTSKLFAGKEQQANTAKFHVHLFG